MVSIPFVDIQHSFRLFYHLDGFGYPILFVHPPAMGCITFKYQLPLAGHFQLIRFDLRGNGQSGFNNEPITIPLLASDIALMLDALQIDKVVICGYSNGGSIALEFALTYSERVSGIILLGGFSEVDTFLLNAEFNLGIQIIKFHGLNLLANILGKSHGNNKEFQIEIEHYVKKANPRILYETYIAGKSYNCTSRLPNLKAPLLLITGAKDEYIHPYQTKFLKYKPDTQIAVISNAHHQLPTKFPNEVNHIIKSFMYQNGFNASKYERLNWKEEISHGKKRPSK